MSFESLGLMSELQRAVSEKGYVAPTPIQLQAIPLILDGRDIMGGAQTGTGKTAGFTLPLLQRLMDSVTPENGRRPIHALVLTPTRELAAQVAESVQIYGKYLPLRSTAIYGGVNINPQKDKLRKGVDILVATPGRLLDHVNQRTVNLSKVEILVLDEADRMLDMGFIHDIRKVLALLPKQKQTLLFSATFPDEIKRLAKDLLKSPALVQATQSNKAPELVTQIVHPVNKGQKRALLSYLIGSKNWKQVLVFTRTKHGANRLADQLKEDGVTATAIHGNKSQGARTKALADFKSGKVRTLVATDIAARGLDINQLPHVVNFELPHMPEDYVHRIGRTGRAGNEGIAMSLVCVDELGLLKGIERLTNRDIPREVIAGFEPNLSIKPEPIHKGRDKQQQPGRKSTGKKAESSRNGKRPHFKGRSNNQAKAQNRSRNQSQNRAGYAS